MYWRMRGLSFVKSNSEFKLKTHNKFHRLRQHVENVRECNEKLRLLEQLFEGCVLSLRDQIAKLVVTTRKTLHSQNDSAISSVLETIDENLSASGELDDDLDAIPELARLLLDALSRSELPNKIKLELSERAKPFGDDGWSILTILRLFESRKVTKNA